MLVNLYKSKTPLAVFSFPLFAGLLTLPVFFKESLVFPGFFSWQQQLEAVVLSLPAVHYIVATVILYLSAIEINRLVNAYGFYGKNTWLPGLIYVLATASFEQACFSSLLIAGGFLIYGVGFLLRINRQDPAKASVFWASFFFGLTTVFEPLLAPVVVLPWLTLFIFRSFVWREWFMLIFGLLIPWLYHYGLYFAITGELSIDIEGLSLNSALVDFSIERLSLMSFVVLLVIYSIWRYLIISNSQLLVFKKRSRLLFHFIWLTMISFGLSWLVYDALIIAVAVPFSIVVSVQLLHSSTLAANLWLVLWIGLVVWNLLV